MIGWNEGTIESSYFITNDNDLFNNGLGDGLFMAQMQIQSSFMGWDFADETANGTDDIWTICEGNDYPGSGGSRWSVSHERQDSEHRRQEEKHK